MPLTLRPAGPGSGIDKDHPDYTIYCGAWDCRPLGGQPQRGLLPAHRYRNLYAGVCWCSAETRTGHLSALADLAVTLGVATAEQADVEKAARAALRRLSEQRSTWLLVYDNVSAPDHIADLLPSAGAWAPHSSTIGD